MTHTLGIIGSGHIGSGLGRLAIAAGWDVVLSNSRGPETLDSVIADLGEHARADTAAGAAQAGDLVVVTIPTRAYRSVPVGELVGKIVVDTMNYYPARDGEIAELTDGMPSSALLQKHLPLSRVIKCFNNIDYVRLENLARPANSPDRSALPIAGDDDDAKSQFTQILNAFGYDAYDQGALAESWRSQPGTPVYVNPYLPTKPDGATISARIGGLADEDSRQWFLTQPGTPLSRDRVRALLAEATR